MQPDLGTLRGSARIDEVVRRLRALGGVDLVVLPELWHVGYFAFDRYEDEAQTLDGAVVTALREAAGGLAAWVHGGSIVERGEDGNLFNTSVLISPDGHVAHTYRKVHLFGYRSKETELLTPGTELRAVDTDIGRIAMVTCYDLRFPEAFRVLSADDAEIVVVASAWPVDRVEHWRLLTRARALDNLSFLVACNAVGEDNGVTLAGRSIVADPWGKVVAEAGDHDEVLRASVDVARVAKVRAEFPFLADRRLRVEGE